MPQPGVRDERADALRSRARSWERDKLISSPQRQAIEAKSQTEWRRVGPILRVVFFVLTLNVLGAIFGFALLLRLPRGVIILIVAITAAEVLIRGVKFFGTGIESALWIGGLCGFIFGLPSQGKVEALLVFAAAAAIAGWRVLNPLFGGIALVLVAVYLAVKTESWEVSLLFCAGMTIIALLVLGRRLERESSETLFWVTLLVMPITGYVAAFVTWILHRGHTTTNVPLAVSMLALAAILLASGVMRRARVELVAGFICLVLAAVELQLMFVYAAETKLIAAGLALVVIGAILSRVLRGKTQGFVVTPTSVTRYDEAMQIAATVALAPHHQAEAAAPQRESGGGGFGGAGASGEF
jgi:hypothetical protein